MDVCDITDVDVDVDVARRGAGLLPITAIEMSAKIRKQLPAENTTRTDLETFIRRV